MIPSIVCPATCELCGNWLPQHQDSCPRNGVHPSQWSCSLIEEQDYEHEQDNQIDIDLELSCHPQDMNHNNYL
ncbi:hypothetical protein K501DRAFT_241164 [Backusella circina FSU 941]|nr:hypothetical protein K501DRAFT_241164 [Backusella circina FSU 941]